MGYRKTVTDQARQLWATANEQLSRSHLARGQDASGPAERLARQLLRDGIRRRLRTISRAEPDLLHSAIALVDETHLESVVRHVHGQSAALWIDAVAQWGGAETAEAIAAHLGWVEQRATLSLWTDPVARLAAIRALRTIGGSRATNALARGASIADYLERERALEALERLASANTPESAEGGTYPSPDEVKTLYALHEVALGQLQVGSATQSVSALIDEVSPELAAHARAVFAAMVSSLLRHLTSTESAERSANAKKCCNYDELCSKYEDRPCMPPLLGLPKKEESRKKE